LYLDGLGCKRWARQKHRGADQQRASGDLRAEGSKVPTNIAHRDACFR
jgi:hypothetical protein